MSAFLGQLIIGWLIADLLTGIFHWWQDRLARHDMPLVGPWLIEPNRLHHRRPMAFTEGSFAQRNLAAVMASLAIAGIWLLMLGPSLMLLAATIGGCVATQVHFYAHKPGAAPAFVRVLQDIGVVQSSSHHSGHHRGPVSRRYCALTGWLNPALDALSVWARAEALLGRLGFGPAKSAGR